MVRVNDKPCQNPIQLTRVMIRVSEITLKEAAERLGVSLTTARRMVKDGRLKAELREGPRGQAYYVEEEQIRTAQMTIDAVPVVRPVPTAALVNAIAARVTETIAEEQARTRAEIEALREELAATREAQERIERSIEERDRKLTETLRTLTERRRTWWEWLLKRR